MAWVIACKTKTERNALITRTCDCGTCIYYSLQMPYILSIFLFYRNLYPAIEVSISILINRDLSDYLLNACLITY